jgi:hypothetical protein
MENIVQLNQGYQMLVCRLCQAAFSTHIFHPMNHKLTHTRVSLPEAHLCMRETYPVVHSRIRETPKYIYIPLVVDRTLSSPAINKTSLPGYA